MMIQLTSPLDVHRWLSDQELNQGNCVHTLGFVPTMGALHEGHLELVKASVTQNHRTLVSIFVNPTQFGPTEDFDTYPKSLEKDLALLNPLGVDAVFTPTINDIYPSHLSDYSTEVYIPALSQKLCGISRPHFFKGVCMVVLRLFNIVRPHHAYFGEKDFQQLSLIKKMVADLFLPITIHGIPIIREADGLAKSSRNQYLTASERTVASAIYKGLCAMREAYLAGTTDAIRLKHIGLDVLKDTPIAVEYLEIVNSTNFDRSDMITPENRIMFAGVLGKTRLIDNMGLSQP